MPPCVKAGDTHCGNCTSAPSRSCRERRPSKEQSRWRINNPPDRYLLQSTSGAAVRYWRTNERSRRGKKPFCVDASVGKAWPGKEKWELWKYKTMLLVAISNVPRSSQSHALLLSLAIQNTHWMEIQFLVCLFYEVIRTVVVPLTANPLIGEFFFPPVCNTACSISLLPISLFGGPDNGYTFQQLTRLHEESFTNQLTDAE